MLTRVQTVWLFNNDLSGGIPSQLGNMSSCTELALYNNRLTGPVPSTLAQVLALRFVSPARIEIDRQIFHEIMTADGARAGFESDS